MKKKTKKKFWLAIRLALVGLFFGTLVLMDMVRPQGPKALPDLSLPDIRKTQEIARDKAEQFKDAARGYTDQAQEEVRQKMDDWAQVTGPRALPSLFPSLPAMMPSLPPLPPLPRMVAPESLLPSDVVFEEGREAQRPPFSQKKTIKDAQGRVPRVPQGGRIALILDDIGLNAPSTARSVALPPFVTLSYLPYAAHVETQVGQAKAAGHTVMLHLPMEPRSKISAGPLALTIDVDESEFQRRLEAFLNRFSGYDGVNNHMGSRLTESRPHMEKVMRALKDRNVFFVDSRTTPHSEAEKVAKEEGIRALARDVFLDDDPSAHAIDAQLRHIEQLAQQKDRVIVIGHPYPTTLAALEAWIPAAREKGFVFVSVLDLVGPK